MSSVSPRALQAADGGVDVADHQRRDAQRRLVHEEQSRSRHQGPADGEHLLLAAGEGAGQLVAPLAQDAEEAVDFFEAVAIAGAVAPAPGVRPQEKVLADREGAENVPPLGHQRAAQRDDPLGAVPPMLRLSRTTEPARGSRTPAMVFRRVVLPAPLAPMMATISPGETCSETPFRTLRAP